MQQPADIRARNLLPVLLILLLVALPLTLSRARAGSPGAGQSQAAAGPAVDREYTLESSMLGYRGVGGDIDGVRNPTLWARTGETVRINLINAELMVHDIALEALNVKSPQILDKAARTNVVFKATKNDTYFCSVPGHRLAGMEGRLDVSDEPRVPSEGIARRKPNGRTLNLDFETGTLDDWTATGDAFSLVQGDVVPGQPPDRRGGKASAYWVSSNIGGGAQERDAVVRTVPRQQPYASFLVSGGSFTSTRVDLVPSPTART